MTWRKGKRFVSSYNVALNPQCNMSQWIISILDSKEVVDHQPLQTDLAVATWCERNSAEAFPEGLLVLRYALTPLKAV